MKPIFTDAGQDIAEYAVRLAVIRVLDGTRGLPDTADIVIALGKAWKRRNRDETVKLLDGIQRV